MLPTSVVSSCRGRPVLLELKDGTTYNGLLVSCDGFMNVSLREVVCTSRDGERFWRAEDVHVRGTSVKYFRVPEEALEMAAKEEASGAASSASSSGTPRGGMQRGRGGFVPRGRGGGGGGGGFRGGNNQAGGRGRGGAPGGGRGRGGAPPRGGRGGA